MREQDREYFDLKDMTDEELEQGLKILLSWKYDFDGSVNEYPGNWHREKLEIEKEMDRRAVEE